MGFPRGSVVKNPPANYKELGVESESSLGWEDCPRERNGNPLQYCCLGNLMSRGAWWVTNSSWSCKRVRYDLATKQQK